MRTKSMLRVISNTIGYKHSFDNKLGSPDIGQWLKNRWENLRIPISLTSFTAAVMALSNHLGASPTQLSDEQLRTAPAVVQQIQTTKPSTTSRPSSPTSQPASQIQDGSIVSDSIMDNKYPEHFIRIMREHLLPNEGGYVNNKKDRGGETGLGGLTRRKYVDWKKKNQEPGETDMHVIPASHLYQIYHDDYWNPVRADELDYPLALCMFDWSINSGPSRPIKRLQRILGMAETGKFDDTLMAKVRQFDQKVLAQKLLQSRHSFIDEGVASGKIDPIFQNGLHNRTNDLQNKIK